MATPTPPSAGKWVLTGGSFIESINGTLTVQGNQKWAYVGATSASITSISPTSGPTTGGTTVTITGAGFNGTNAVNFGTTPVKFTFVSDSVVTAITKPGTGTVDVTVITTNDGTTSVTPADRFTYSGGSVTPPPSPTFSASASLDGTQCAVSWTNVSPTELGRNGTDSSGAGPWNTGVLTGQPTSGSYTFLKLIPGDTYTYTLTESSGATLTTTLAQPSPTPTPPPPPPSGLPLFGMYVQDESGSLAAIQSRLPALGNPPLTIVQNYAADSTWAQLANVGWITGPESSDGNQTLLLSAGLTATGESFGQTANIQSTFTSIAQACTAIPNKTILRIGWEFNGGWYAWAAKSNPTGFAADFRTAVEAVWAVDSSIQIDWCAAVGQYWDITQAYPGAEYVTYHGIDVYPQSWITLPNGATTPNNLPTYSSQVWNYLLTAQYDGLNAIAAFAATNNKQISIPEFSCIFRSDGQGTGDDPGFIADINAWSKSNNVGYVSLFCSDQNSDGQSDLTDGKFPNALAKFKSLTW